jgi:hypothetical protein
MVIEYLKAVLWLLPPAGEVITRRFHALLEQGFSDGFKLTSILIRYSFSLSKRGWVRWKVRSPSLVSIIRPRSLYQDGPQGKYAEGGILRRNIQEDNLSRSSRVERPLLGFVHY